VSTAESQGAPSACRGGRNPRAGVRSRPRPPHEHGNGPRPDQPDPDRAQTECCGRPAPPASNLVLSPCVIGRGRATPGGERHARRRAPRPAAPGPRRAAPPGGESHARRREPRPATPRRPASRPRHAGSGPPRLAATPRRDDPLAAPGHSRYNRTNVPLGVGRGLVPVAWPREAGRRTVARPLGTWRDHCPQAVHRACTGSGRISTEPRPGSRCRVAQGKIPQHLVFSRLD